LKGKIARVYVVFCLVAVAGASILTGCYEPPERQAMDSGQAFLKIADIVRRLSGGLTDDMNVVADFPLARKLYTFVNGGMSCSAEMINDPVSGLPIGTGEEVCAFEPGPYELNLEFDEIGENFLNLLDEYVFDPAQVESEGFGALILLDPDVFCRMFSDGSDAGDTGGAVGGALMTGEGESEVPEAYTLCHDILSAVPVRVDVYSYWEDSIYLDVLVGDSRTYAAGIVLWGDTMSVDVDLSYLAAALDVVNNLFKDEDRALYDSLTARGRVAAYISRDYNGLHYIHGEVYDRLEVSLVRPEGEYALEADYTIFYIWADADINEFQVTLSAQDFDASFPYQIFVDAFNASSEAPVDVGGSIHVRSDGADFVAHGKPNDGTIVVTGIGLGSGPMTVSRGFDTIFGLALNPDDGHVFDMVLSQDGDGRIVAALSDVFDLSIGWNLGTLASDLDEIPAGMVDETWRILLDGAAPAVTIMDGVEGEWFRIDAGTLTMSSSAAPEESVAATAGQCVSVTGDETHPLLTALAAGECAGPTPL